VAEMTRRSDDRPRRTLVMISWAGLCQTKGLGLSFLTVFDLFGVVGREAHACQGKRSCGGRSSSD
jgi:hypothetical protein